MATTQRFAPLLLPLGLAALGLACTPATPPTLAPGTGGDAAATAPVNPGVSPDPSGSGTPAPAGSTAPTPTPLPSKVPVVRFLGLDGQEKGLEAFSGVRIVTFWATWCSHCQAELPKLDTWAKAEARAGWAWVPIEASLSSKEDVAKFKTNYKIQSDLYFDPSGAVADALQVTGFPTTIVVDAQGKILFRKNGEAGPEAFQSYLPAK